jgi:hypothetical protein
MNMTAQKIVKKDWTKELKNIYRVDMAQLLWQQVCIQEFVQPKNVGNMHHPHRTEGIKNIKGTLGERKWPLCKQ